VTRDAGGLVLDSASISGISITKTAINNAAVTVSSANAGGVAEYSFSFTTAINLRIGSYLELEFPLLAASKYVVSAATLANTTNVDAESTTIQILSQYVRLVVAGQAIISGTAVSVTYGSITNPAAQSTTSFVVRTRHSSGGIYQESGAVAGPAIVSTTLPASAVTVTPVSYFAGVSTSYTVQFDNTNVYLPSGSQLSIVFPSRFGISGATLTGLATIGSTNTVLIAGSVASTVALTIGSLPITAGTGRSFTFSGIVNPGSSCDEFIVEYCSITWETYTFTMSDSSGSLFAQTSAVAGTPIVKKPMAFARVRPRLKTPNTITTATVTLDTETPIAVGGAVEVVFPAGYVVNAAATLVSGSLVGIPATSAGAVTVTGLRVSLAIAGGVSIPATAGLAFSVTGVTTPPLLTVGSYIVRTRDAFGKIVEESTGVFGEGCTHLNDCNGHGQCTLLSKTCICNTGWGDPTDVAAYRSPDCTTRVYWTLVA
jgi:hypothetical protein